MMNPVNMLVKDAPDVSASPRGVKDGAARGHGGFSRTLDGVNGRQTRQDAAADRSEPVAVNAGEDPAAQDVSSEENTATTSQDTVARKLAARALRLARDTADAAGAARGALDKAAVARAGKEEHGAVAAVPGKETSARALRDAKVATKTDDPAVERHALQADGEARPVMTKVAKSEEAPAMDEAQVPGGTAVAAEHMRSDAALGDMLGMLAVSGGAAAAGGKAAQWRDATGTDKAGAGGVSARQAHVEVVDGEDASREADAAAGEGEGRLFRLQRGEARGEAVDLRLSAGVDGRVEAEAKVPGQARADTVSVLDARRYLGFDTPSNAASLATAMTGEGDWAAAMRPGARLANEAQLSSTGQVVNTLKLQMTPESLGTVTATLRLAGDELSVHLTAHTAAGYRELKDDASAMLDALRSQGFSVDQVSVSMSSSSAQSQGQSGHDGNGQFAQQGPGEGRRDDGRGAQQDARRFQAAEETAGTVGGSDETDMAAAPARTAGGTRPGHVYL